MNERKWLYLSIIVTHHPSPTPMQPANIRRLTPSHKSLKKTQNPLAKKIEKTNCFILYFRPKVYNFVG